jgi:hypothetical protein
MVTKVDGIMREGGPSGSRSVTIRYPEDLDSADVFRARRHEGLDESRMRENRKSGLARGRLETGHDSYCASPLLYYFRLFLMAIAFLISKFEAISQLFIDFVG